MQKPLPVAAAPTVHPVRLRHRSEFLSVAKGARAHMRLLTLQALRQPMPDPPRFGLTVTKKEGGAVERNRIRRRLKEALRIVASLHARDNHDYVIVGRKDVLHARFAEIQNELVRALAKVHRNGAKIPDRARSAEKPFMKEQAQTP